MVIKRPGLEFVFKKELLSYRVEWMANKSNAMMIFFVKLLNVSFIQQSKTFTFGGFGRTMIRAIKSKILRMSKVVSLGLNYYSIMGPAN